MVRIAFHTANFFGRASNYETSMEEWGDAERRVIESFSLDEFDRICSDISEAGFQYIELWMGHAFPKFMTSFFADEMKAIWQKHDLSVIRYSCSLGDPVNFPHWTKMCFETSKMLGIDHITSGISQESAPIVYDLCCKYDMTAAVENHPEKHPDEIKAVIGDYGDRIGACVDTGWFGTQDYPAHEAIKQLKDHLHHIHLKDVRETGAHNTTRLGTGIVDIDSCINVIREIGYNSTISIEHEAGDHNPTQDCITAKRWTEQLLQQNSMTT